MQTIAVFGVAALMGWIVAGCAPPTVTSAFGSPRPPRAPNCELMLASLSDLGPGGKYMNTHEMVGSVVVTARVGAQATDDEVKKELRPKACAFGGEVIVPMTSAGARNGFGSEVAQHLSFAVYAKKTVAPASQRY